MAWRHLLTATAVLATPVAAQDPAAGKKPGETFKDCADCQTLVVVPAGRFKMGSTPEERAREGVPAVFGDHEGPVRDIAIAKPFAIATTETTRGQFAQFARETSRPLPTECATYNPKEDSWAGVPGNVANWQKPGFAQDDTHPVVCVSFVDATDYAAWLSKKTGHRYRLPSEAEWEYAARAGTSGALPWTGSICAFANVGDATRAARDNRGVIDPARFVACDDRAAATAPVASYRANPWGLYDMIGNVWEWTLDCDDPADPGIAPTAAPRTSGPCTSHLDRGASWTNSPKYLRTAARHPDLVGARTSVLGIRLVEDLP